MRGVFALKKTITHFLVKTVFLHTITINGATSLASVLLLFTISSIHVWLAQNHKYNVERAIEPESFIYISTCRAAVVGCTFFHLIKAHLAIITEILLRGTQTQSQPNIYLWSCYWFDLGHYLPILLKKRRFTFFTSADLS